MSTIICVLARMESKRLYGKAAMDIDGLTLLEQLFCRLSVTPWPIILCTNVDSKIPDIEQLDCEGIVYGSDLDCMSRLIEAATIHDADTVIRVTGDNPLTDPDLMESLHSLHVTAESKYTYTENHPRGVRSEIIEVSALRALYDCLRTHEKHDTEHMSNYLHRITQRSRVILPQHYSTHSFTVDTEEDLERVRKIFKHYGSPPPFPQIIRERPEWDR